MSESSREGRAGRAGEDRDHQLAALQVRPDLATDLAEHLGLDPEQDDVGAVDGLEVVGDDADPVLGSEVVAALGTRVAGDDLVRRDELAAQEAGDHRLGHHP